MPRRLSKDPQNFVRPFPYKISQFCFKPPTAYFILDESEIEEFERATMTRIGRCQIKTAQSSWQCILRRDNLAPLNIPRTKITSLS